MNQTEILANLDPDTIHYEYLSVGVRAYLQFSATAITFMSVCLTCTIWQIKAAIQLVYNTRRWINYAVLFQALLSFSAIFCSVLNPLTESIDCEMRFWLSIITVDLAGCCVQTILLYKAYICYDRTKWLLIIGSLINMGYIALIFIYASLGKVPTYKDLVGMCVMQNLEWPALAKLGLDVASNIFLTIAFVLVISRHYRVFGNSLHKTLLSNGIIFSVGVIASNIITAILISTRALGGLSADLYSFDWVITTYLLIRQFNSAKTQEDLKKEMDEEEADYDTDEEDKISINLSTLGMGTVKHTEPVEQKIVSAEDIMKHEKLNYEHETQRERNLRLSSNAATLRPNDDSIINLNKA